jgi:hypothetical protein
MAHHARRSLALTTALFSLAACGTHQGVAARPVAPVEGLERRGSTSAGLGDAGTLTVGRLQSLLMAHADRAIAGMARAGAAARAADSSAAIRFATQQVQTDVAMAAVALAVEPEPDRALLDLMVSTAAQRRAIGSTGSAKALGGPARDAMATEIAALEGEVWRIGAQVYAPAELDLLRARVDRWAAAWNGESFPGIVRLADLPEGGQQTASKGLLAPLDEANRQIEQTRMLGERFLFLAERLPVLSRWQAEAMAWQAMNTPESRQALDGLTLISGTMARLSRQVDSMPAAMLAAFDARQHALQGTLRDATALTADGKELAASGERVMSLSKETAATLGETIRAADRLLASLRDAKAPGGPVSLDINQYLKAATELRGAAEALNSALANGGTAAGASRGWVDHAAWRAAQLIILVFMLLLGYRWAAPRLAPRDPAAGT